MARGFHRALSGDLLMTRLVIVVALVISFATTASAQGTNPIRYTWIATSCETWNCAAAALVMADGSPDVIVLPTNRDDRPWLILRRVEEGSLFIPEDEPFTCEVFENVTEATSRFTALDGCHAPLILNVPDGRAIVTSLLNCTSGGKKRRAAG
jgi:hypothetical protein